MRGIIIGSTLLDCDIIKDLKKETIETDHGSVEVMRNDKIIVLQRHGDAVPPHAINYKANISALKEVDEIIAFNSSGSLQPEIKPGDIVIPTDYMDFRNDHSFYNEELEFTVPGLDMKLIERICDSIFEKDIIYTKGGVYYQSRGPRFETKAEIRMLQNYAQLVGMTMANEATLAKELDIPYCSVCAVDNYANGVNDTTIDFMELKKIHTITKDRLQEIIKIVGEME